MQREKRMKVTSEEFFSKSRSVLNTDLPGTMKHATSVIDKKRERAYADFPCIQDYRNRARQIKEWSINNLDDLLGVLRNRIEGLGGSVYWAERGEDANRYILDLANRKGISHIVKAKSMISEETALNEALEESGKEVTETDLGEYILQLAGDSPSHLIGPAVHKTRFDVADLFEKKLGMPRTEDPGELTRIARQTLRQKFLDAEMGITGVNFATAEEGAIVLVTNEGNGRIVTTMPRVHVAMMSIEKVIPSFEELAVFLELLGRAATGVKLSAYTTLISPPDGNFGVDGPEEFHLVILDNGRRKMLADPELREAFYCIRCGACQNTCPIYQKIGGHPYGWVYAGPIGSVLTPLFVGTRRSKYLPFACTLCHACANVCPVKINIPKLLLRLRKKMVYGDPPLVQGAATRKEKSFMLLWSKAMQGKAQYGGLTRLGRFILNRYKDKDNIIRRLPFLGSNWTKSRDMFPVAQETFHERWRKKKCLQGDTSNRLLRR